MNEIKEIRLTKWKRKLKYNKEIDKKKFLFLKFLTFDIRKIH